MVTALTFLAHLGLAAAASVLGSVASRSYKEAVNRHSDAILKCRERMASRKQQTDNAVRFAAAKAAYIESIKVANATWAFLKQERENLRILRFCIHRLMKDLERCPAENRGALLASLAEVQNTAGLIAENSGALKAKVTMLNQQTASLREQFPRFGGAGVRYYQHLQAFRETRLLKRENF